MVEANNNCSGNNMRKEQGQGVGTKEGQEQSSYATHKCEGKG